MRLFDENGNEVEVDAQGKVVRKKKDIMRDGEIVRVPMMFMDNKTLDDAQSAKDAIVDRAAKVRADIDRDLATKYGVPQEPHPFQYADRRGGTVAQSDDVRAQRTALYDAADARLSNAWRNPRGREGDDE